METNISGSRGKESLRIAAANIPDNQMLHADDAGLVPSETL